jgi:hypothetical protein
MEPLMSRARLVFALSTLGLAGAAIPVAARAQARDQICRDVENQRMTIGTWASYEWTGGPSNGSKMRVAVVGKETHDGATYYWYEVTLDDARRPKDSMILQMLIPGLLGTPRSVVMKAGQRPAMRMPEQMVRMMASQRGSNVAAEIARGCKEMEVVGWEQITVPAGSFRTLHLRHPQSGVNAWIQPSLNFAMVKATMKDGGTMALSGQGTGAKSSITETPQDMTGFPGGPPR